MCVALYVPDLVRTRVMELEAFESTVRSLFSQGWTYERINTYFQQLTGVTQGFSCGTVRRFCQVRGLLRRHTLGENELDQCIRMYVLRVGHAFTENYARASLF